jgi:hypothetical protein
MPPLAGAGHTHTHAYAQGTAWPGRPAPRRVSTAAHPSADPAQPWPSARASSNFMSGREGGESSTQRHSRAWPRYTTPRWPPTCDSRSLPGGILRDQSSDHCYLTPAISSFDRLLGKTDRQKDRSSCPDGSSRNGRQRQESESSDVVGPASGPSVGARMNGWWRAARVRAKVLPGCRLAPCRAPRVPRSASRHRWSPALTRVGAQKQGREAAIKASEWRYCCGLLCLELCTRVLRSRVCREERLGRGRGREGESREARARVHRLWTAILRAVPLQALQGQGLRAALHVKAGDGIDAPILGASE